MRAPFARFRNVTRDAVLENLRARGGQAPGVRLSACGPHLAERNSGELER
jgi:hypothetical protein